MLKNILGILLSLQICFFAQIAQAVEPSSAPAIERIEPPFWWVGMKSEKLQLMVYGKNIAAYAPEISYPGVRVDAVTRLTSPNYAFIDLRLAPDVAPGKMNIIFKLGAQKVEFSYSLLAREQNSATRKSFSNADVILNFMPDRFSNGDPSNDNLPGFLDPLNRADDSAGRHGGDIKGIENHLDYIAGMGYTMLWPTPLTESNQAKYSYHGYAATDTYKIDPRYGSNADYKRLVDKARSKGLGMIMDVVLNHIGSNHWWMKDLPTSDWLSLDSKFAPTYHARTTATDPYSAKVDRVNFTKGWFELNMPDMNQQNRYVATYQIQNAIWWVEYAGLAGIRVDTYGYSDHAFLSEWSRRLHEEYPTMNMVGEEWSINPIVVSYWQKDKQNPNGYVSSLPSLMDFPLNDSLRKALVQPDDFQSGFPSLYERLNDDIVYPNPNNLVLFEGNHDIGRLYSVLDEDLDLYKMAIAYVATMRGIPQFYYGTEILMTSPKKRDDGAFRRDFPGGWAGDKVNAVTGAGLTDRQKEAQAFVKKLLNWRKTQPAVHTGKLMHYAPEDGTYVYVRTDVPTNKKVMVVFNKNQKEKSLPTARFVEALGNATIGVDVISGKAYRVESTLTVPARAVLVLELKQ
jgi:neopullulanase